MMKPKVYFTDMRCKVGVGLLDKLTTMLEKSGMDDIDFTGKYVAIKIHFGEPGNLAFLRPNFAKAVADYVRKLGGKPFLTDCNTLYVGRRRDALEHLESAQENGFSPLSTGCQIIIADGLKGGDEVEVPVQGGEYCATAKIGRAVMDADIFISLNHFKGHEATGFGGALKNIGMGCGSRAGKMHMHNEGKLRVSPKKCRACGLCQRFCGQDAISYDAQGIASINQEKCVGCGRCFGACGFNAIYNPTESDNNALNCKIAEYSKAVVQGRPHFHISVVNQVSPYCDCHGGNDAAVVPDIGMFASFDPVAIDRACIDAVNKAPKIPGSAADLETHTGHDHFTNIHPATDWHSQIEHAEKIGLGSGEYELVRV